jgi:hypothetical protein
MEISGVVIGEQQYCRKWHSDKMPRTDLGHNGKKIFQKCQLGTKCQIYVFVVSN